MAGLVVRKSNPLAAVGNMSAEQVKLVKDTVCRGATDNELALFLYTAKQTGLDPLRRQIHAVKRWDSQLNREVMSIQTGIDGYRLLAERTGAYAPGPEPTFKYDSDGKVISATAYVKKLVAGQWFDVGATALYSEYVGRKKDGSPNQFWATKPHVMLGKCAEALALRRAFPDALAGVYSDDEMQQAENLPIVPKTHPEPAPKAEDHGRPGAIVDADFTVEPDPEAPANNERPNSTDSRNGGDSGRVASGESGALVNNSGGNAAPPPPSACISDAQRKRLWAILLKGSKDQAEKDARTAQLKDFMQANIGHVHTEQISRNDYEKVCKEAERIAGHVA